MDYCDIHEMVVGPEFETCPYCQMNELESRYKVEKCAVIELREAAARMLSAIETLGRLKAVNRDDDPGNWKYYMEPILTDAHARLNTALKRR